MINTTDLDQLELGVRRRFASDASHELRTPIAGLRVKLEEMLLYPDEADVPEVLQQALRDTERLEAIVADLLLLTRLGAHDDAATEPIDLTALLTWEIASRIIGRQVHTELEPAVIVNGVLSQLTRLLGNLLDNAQQHADERIDVHLRGDADQAVLTVTDDGAGIPSADRERVFLHFTRLDPARSRTTGGTGLGLAIARDIAQAHNGTLDIHESRRGACFVLKLPRSTATEEGGRPCRPL